MIAGLPACGIGGVFYLLSAIFMPIIELNKMLRRKARRNPKERWKLIAFQLMVALSMIGGFWLTGEVLGQFTAVIGVVPRGRVIPAHHNLVSAKPFFISSILLFFVLAFAHFQGIIVAKRLRK